MRSLRDRLSEVGERVRRGLDPGVPEPVLPPPPPGRWWAARVLPAEVLARVDAMPLHDAGHGVDNLGMSRDGVAAALAAAWPLYRYWFRVRAHGAEGLPASGPAVLAANHSGMLPLDAVMIAADVLLRAPVPRPVRVILDRFVEQLPVVSPAFARAGAVGGSRANVHELLQRGELVLIFPEGTDGIGKPFSERYRLQRWTEGHAELAIRHRAPVIPVAVIGAEEQWPQVGRLRGLRPFGVPWLPVPATPLPLPVRYHVWYGAPIPLHERHPPEHADDPDHVRRAACEVRDAVAALVDRGLQEREGVFA